MSIKEWKNEEISALLSEAWGFKFGLDELNEGYPDVGSAETIEDDEAGTTGRLARGLKKEGEEAEIDEEVELDEDKPYTAKKEDEDEDLRKGAEKRGGEGTLAKTPGHGKVDYVNEDKPYTAKKEEPGEDLRKGAEKRGAEGTLAKTKGHGKVDYVKEDTGEDEAWHEWKNEHADDDHIREIEHHLRALKDDRDYERHGAEYDHDRYEDEGMEEGMDERRGRGRKGPHTRTDDPRLREVMNTVAKKYPNISEERMQQLAAYALRARK